MTIELDLIPLSAWVETLSAPLLIAGPCSAETEEQLVETCVQIAAFRKASVLRAGIWKPRTRPGEFEGIGEIGLEWLRSAKLETGLPVAVEVATAKHVELALKHAVDILWVGARSTANPFTVQEIADSLKGVNVPVFVKNPVNPDIQLWVGALERMNKAGIRKLGAIHRGFSSFEKTIYRNDPMWQIAISLKTLCPQLPIVTDPSHITGNRDLIQFVSQKALDLDMQGLMIEVHRDPSKAWTDAKQQLTPFSLNALMNELVVRKPDSSNKEFSDRLSQFRRDIDLLDDQVIQKLAQRMEIVEKIGEYKRNNDVTVLQVGRWDHIMRKRTEHARVLKLNEAFVQKFLELIHNESIRKQTEIMNHSRIERDEA